MTELVWKPLYPNSGTYLYAYADVMGNKVAYYVHTLSDTHPIEEYRHRWTADVNGCTLFEYRPALTPIFHDSLEDAKAACERDLVRLRERWQAMLERAKEDPNQFISFANLS
ncbi:predicted ORF [Xanthomonas phage XacN1]|nr:predicted ORF [Xanthomonas phage XacN1]